MFRPTCIYRGITTITTVPFSRGGQKMANPVREMNTVADGRKGDPQQDFEGKNHKIHDFRSTFCVFFHFVHILVRLPERIFFALILCILELFSTFFCRFFIFLRFFNIFSNFLTEFGKWYGPFLPIRIIYKKLETLRGK